MTAAVGITPALAHVPSFRTGGCGREADSRTQHEASVRPIIGIQQILRGREAKPRSIRDMAKNYADRIQKMYPTGALKLLGWSFGGVVTHELAIELQRRGCVIARIILLDAQTSIDSIGTLPENALGEKDSLEEILRLCRIDIREQDQPIAYEQAEELVGEQAVIEFARYKQRRDLIIQIINTDMALYRTHEPGVFDGDTIIFSVVEDEGDRSSSVLDRPLR